MDVIPTYITTSNAFEFTRENVFTNSAAETAEGATKPESSVTFTLQNVPIRTIAHFLKLSKQVLEDSAALESYINTRLRYGAMLKLETQLVNGNGTGQNISGILDTGNHTAFTPTAGDNALDSINKGIEQVALADYNADAIMLNPADWHAIDRLKVGTSDARYVVGNPASGLAAQLWGLPVVVTNSVPSGKFIVGAMNVAFGLFNAAVWLLKCLSQTNQTFSDICDCSCRLRSALASFRQHLALLATCWLLKAVHNHGEVVGGVKPPSFPFGF